MEEGLTFQGDESEAERCDFSRSFCRSISNPVNTFVFIDTGRQWDFCNPCGAQSSFGSALFGSACSGWCWGSLRTVPPASRLSSFVTGGRGAQATPGRTGPWFTSAPLNLQASAFSLRDLAVVGWVPQAQLPLWPWQCCLGGGWVSPFDHGTWLHSGWFVFGRGRGPEPRFSSEVWPSLTSALCGVGASRCWKPSLCPYIGSFIHVSEYIFMHSWILT